MVCAVQVLDVGCGIGGPLREIALFSGASVTGEDNFKHEHGDVMVNVNRGAHERLTRTSGQ